jgi:hypothetical protein
LPSPERRRDRGLGGLGEGGVAADRRKRLGQPGRGRLVEADRPVEVLEALLAEVPQEDVEVFLLVLEERLGRLRDEDLPAVPGRSDPRRAMDGKSRVAAVVRDRLAGVQAHPDLDLDIVRPRVREERTLAFDCSQ